MLYVLTFTWPALPPPFIYIIVGLFAPFKDIIIYCLTHGAAEASPLTPPRAVVREQGSSSPKG